MATEKINVTDLFDKFLTTYRQTHVSVNGQVESERLEENEKRAEIEVVVEQQKENERDNNNGKEERKVEDKRREI